MTPPQIAKPRREKAQAEPPQVGKRPVGRPRKVRLIDTVELAETPVRPPTAADLMERKIPGSSAFRAIRDLMTVDPEMSLTRRGVGVNRVQQALFNLADRDLQAGEEALRLVQRLHRHMAAHPGLNLQALCVEVSARCPDTQSGPGQPGDRFLRSLDLVDEFLHQQGAVLK